MPPQPAPAGPPAEPARPRLAERLAAMERELGRAPAEEPAPPDPDQTHQEAAAVLLAGLPGEVLGTFRHLDDGQFMNERTGEIVDKLP